MEFDTYVSGNFMFTHPGTATVDFSHGIQFLGDSATAGATLVANSGHNYATPLPPSITVAKSVGDNSPIPSGAGNFTGFQSPTYPSVAPQPSISGGTLAFVAAGTGGQQGDVRPLRPATAARY